MFFTELRTERLILKNIGDCDREFVFSQFSDITVCKYLYDAEPLVNIQGADEIIEYYLQSEPRSHHRWIMVRESDCEKMGTCGFHRWDVQNQIVDIGYDMKEKFWGHGYMREALRSIISFARETMNVNEIRACIYVDNLKSVRLAEELGFVVSGKYNEIFRGEEYLHHIYSLYLAAR